MSKGSRQRPVDNRDHFNREFDRIFGKPKPKPEPKDQDGKRIQAP